MSIFVHYGSTAFDPEMFVYPQNMSGRNKPYGGFWASAVDAQFGWKDWNESEGFRTCREDNSFQFKLAEDARILVIDSLEKAQELPRIPCFPTWTVDFETIMTKFDVIDFCLSKDRSLYDALYGWDCDSILILHPDVIIPIERR